MKKASISVAVAIVAWLIPNLALAQVGGTYQTTASKYDATTTRPTVSPYLNLLDNNNLANYQTLVRPLIDEREELNKQWARLEQINRQMGMPQDLQRPQSSRPGTGGQGPSAVRFMHYSHYFGSR